VKSQAEPLAVVTYFRRRQQACFSTKGLAYPSVGSVVENDRTALAALQNCKMFQG
jgi:hypothetical protein